MTDIDDRLHDYAARWRATQPAPVPTWPGTDLTGPGDRRVRHPGRLALAAAAAVLLAAGGLAVAAHHPATRQVPTAVAGSVPVATPPLVRGGLRPTGRVDLSTGRSGTVAWTFFAEYLQKEKPPGVGPGLCLGLAMSQESSAGCDDPAKMLSLTVGFSNLAGDPATVLVNGVTSAPAATFSIRLGQVSLSAPALSAAALPGLWFYALPVPSADVPPGSAVTVEAVSAGGVALLRNDPRLTPPLPPAAVGHQGSWAGPQAIWPAGSPASGPPSALALAGAFAAQVLGLNDPAVTAGPASPGVDIAPITIRLPATGQVLRGLAQRKSDQSWALIQLGDQSHLVGITMLPGGHPGPVMALAPPRPAVQADVTEVAADGPHRVHLTAADLATRTLHFPTDAAVVSVIVVYRDGAGAPVDAFGESFA